MIRAITIRQPWAQCVVGGHKNVENRSHPTRLRGEVAIHAGKAPSPEGDTDPRVIRLWGPDPRIGMPVGAILAVAELTDCHEARTSCLVEGSPCWPWGDGTYKGRTNFHLMFANVRRLDEPVPCRGQLGIGWPVPDDVERHIRKQLFEAAR